MPSSFETLPTELVRLIVELAVPPESLVFEATKRRRKALVSLLPVNRRIEAIVRSILRETVLVDPIAQAEQLAKEARQGGHGQVTSIAVSFCPDPSTRRYDFGEPHPATWDEAAAFFANFPSLRHASLAGLSNPMKPLVVNVEVNDDSFLLRLESLLIMKCRVQASPSLLFSRLRLVRLALHASASTGLEDYLTPEVFPALRFLRLSTDPNFPMSLFCAQRICHQLAALQIDCDAPYKLTHFHIDQVFLAYRDVLDRTLFSCFDTLRHLKLAQEMRYFYCPRAYGSKLKERLEDIAARGPRSQLEIVYLPRNIVVEPSYLIYNRQLPHGSDEAVKTALCDLVHSVGAKVIWLDAEEPYDFILPEFERYLKERK